MTQDSFGNKQYIAVEGKDKAFALAAALLEANPNDQILIQLDDCDIYIVSWACRYNDGMGEQFVWMNEDEHDDYSDWREAREERKNGAN